jgi:hypothetical protein
MPSQREFFPLRWIAIVVTLLLLMGCGARPDLKPVTETGSVKTFHVPRKNIPLTLEQEAVRQQATSAVEADIDGYLERYIEIITAEHDQDGRIVKPGSSNIVDAMRHGPLVINADDMRDLFPQYTASRASRSLHSDSVHEAVSAMAAELYRRALLIDDPRGNNTVLFTAGGGGSGKTTAIRTIDEIRRTALAAQIIYDGTMSSYKSSHQRVTQALEADKLVGVVFVFAPIEKSAGWLVKRAVKSGRVVPAVIAAKSHWRAQQTFLQLVDEYQGNPAISFRLIDKSDEVAKVVPPETMKRLLYSNDGRFKDMAAFVVYVKKLIRAELEKVRADGKLLPETEEAFKAEE